MQESKQQVTEVCSCLLKQMEEHGDGSSKTSLRFDKKSESLTKVRSSNSSENANSYMHTSQFYC